MTHTKGPWVYGSYKFDDWGAVRTEEDENGFSSLICHARNPDVSFQKLGDYRKNKKDPYGANAHLIAAAPDLLEALELCMSWIKYWDPDFSDDDEWILTSRPYIEAAIKKAKGE